MDKLTLSSKARQLFTLFMKRDFFFPHFCVARWAWNKNRNQDFQTSACSASNTSRPSKPLLFKQPHACPTLNISRTLCLHTFMPFFLFLLCLNTIIPIYLYAVLPLESVGRFSCALMVCWWGVGAVLLVLFWPFKTIPVMLFQTSFTAAATFEKKKSIASLKLNTEIIGLWLFEYYLFHLLSTQQ